VTILAAYISTFFQPGIGLVNSFGSGKVYIGADWNHHPVPTQDEVPSWTWWFPYAGVFATLAPPFDVIGIHKLVAWFSNGSGHLMTLTSVGFIGGFPMIEHFLQAGMALLYKMYLTMFLHVHANPTRSESLRRSHEDLGSPPPKPGRIFSYPETKRFVFTHRFWHMTLHFEPFVNKYVAKLHWLIFVVFASNCVPYYIFKPVYITETDDGLVKWMHLAHIAFLLQLFYLVFWFPFWWKMIMLPHIYRQLELGKHLSSAAAFKSRIGAFKEIEFSVTIFAVTLGSACTILMPYGMAMQTWGVSRSYWPSPLNFVFNQPGEASNMLGAPIHALCYKVIFTLMAWRYFTVYPENMQKRAKTAQSITTRT